MGRTEGRFLRGRCLAWVRNTGRRTWLPRQVRNAPRLVGLWKWPRFVHRQEWHRMTIRARVTGTAASDPATEICAMGALELGRHYRARELSPVEVTQAVLDRIERIDPELN